VQQGQAVQQGQPAPRGQFGQGQQRTALRAQGQESVADHQIATWLTECNEVEVRLSQIAAKESKDKDVKQFAEKMIDAHGNLINQLRQFAPDAPMLSGHTAQQRTADQGQPAQGQPAQGRPAQGQPGQFPQGGPQANPQAGLPINTISHQLAERALASAQKELSKKQGSEFDKCFIGAQVHEHMAMLNALEVLRPYASQQLQPVLNQGIEHTQAHLDQAKHIMEQLSGGTSEKRTSDREQKDKD